MAESNPHDDPERVWHTDMVSAFYREKIQRDGIILEVEGITTIDDSPDDSDARYTLEVRASLDTQQSER